MKLEEKLVSLRKAKGLSQLQLAEKMNVSRQAISKWEIGSAVPSTDSLRCLSELYGVSIDYLINEENEFSRQDEKVTGEKRSPRKKLVWLICTGILVVAVVAAIIAVVKRSEPEIVSFNEAKSEDWNSVSTDEIQIVW